MCHRKPRAFQFRVAWKAWRVVVPSGVMASWVRLAARASAYWSQLERKKGEEMSRRRRVLWGGTGAANWSQLERKKGGRGGGGGALPTSGYHKPYTLNPNSPHLNAMVAISSSMRLRASHRSSTCLQGGGEQGGMCSRVRHRHWHWLR